MGEEDEIRKHFEDLLGDDMIDPDAGVVVVQRNFATYDRVEGFVTQRETGAFGNTSKRCRIIDLLDVSSIAQTGQNGIVELLLSDYVCGAPTIVGPANVLATALGGRPIFMTAERRVVNNDVQMLFRAWDPNGQPVSGVIFDWRCRVPYRRAGDDVG